MHPSKSTASPIAVAAGGFQGADGCTVVGIVKLNELYAPVHYCELNRPETELTARQGEGNRDYWTNTFRGRSRRLKVSMGAGSQGAPQFK